MKKTILLIGIIISCFPLLSQVTLLSGFEGGSYHQMANELKEITNLKLEIFPSKGSRDNFFELRESNVDVAFVQYDVLFYQTGIEEDNKKIQAIRILLPMGYEEIHLVTRKSNNINTLADLKRKKVGVGDKYQGTIITASYIRDVLGAKWRERHVSFETAFQALADGKIDAFFFVGSAPVGALNDIPKELEGDLKLVPIENKELEDYYAKTTIKASCYSWLDEDVSSYAVRYALATNTYEETELDEQNIKQLLMDIKNNLVELQNNGHRMWKHVDLEFDRIIWDVHEISKEVFDLENVEHQF